MAPTDTALVEALTRIERKVDQLIEDVNAPPRHGEPGGLLVRQEKTDDAIERLTLQLDGLRRRLEDLEATPGKTAITWWDRVGLGLLGIILSGLGAIVGAQLAGKH